tara:strand:- start:3840 stop:4442 length:603 start_codon:yes stop_codon:yes gene_type:complete
MKLVFLDTETTGLNRWKHDIIQIALVIIEDGEITFENEYKFHPERPDNADPEALRVNGYTKEAWDGAYKWSKEACERLANHIKDGIVIGHNVKFDTGFLRELFKRYNVKCRFPPEIDTKALAKIVWGDSGLDSLSMDNIRQHTGMNTEGAHTALKDAKDCMIIWKCFISKAKYDERLFSKKMNKDTNSSVVLLQPQNKRS